MVLFGGSHADQPSIDDELLEKAQKLGGHRTKDDTVNQALEEYIRRLIQLRSLDAIGTFDFDPMWDYKAARRKR